MATEKTDVKNVRMNKNNVLVKGRGKKAQEICTVDKYQADWIKHFDKAKTRSASVAWLSGVVTLCNVAAGSIVLNNRDLDSIDKFVAASHFLFGLVYVFCLGRGLKNVSEYKKMLNEEYVEAIENNQVKHEEMGK